MKVFKDKKIVNYIIILLTILIILLLLLFLVNGPLFEDYYLDKKVAKMKAAYEEINSAFNEGNIKSEEFEVAFQSIVDRNNVSIIILDTTTKTIKASSQDYDRLSEKLIGYIFGKNIAESNEIIFVDPDNKYEIHRTQDDRMSAEYVELWGILDNGDPFLIRSPLESIKEASKVSGMFFNYIIIAMMMVILVGLILYTHYTTVANLEKKNKQLEYDIKQKEELDNMRSEFLSGISHELKTPIALIQGYAEGLMECVNEDEESKNYYCDVIMDEASKMNSIVGKMLNINHLEFGDVEFDYSNFDIIELIGNYLNGVKILYEGNDINIDFDRTKSIMVYSDEYYVEEIFGNYFTNAVNHVDKNRVIKIDASIINDEVVRVSVYNTGENIPEESLNRLFDKFYKVDKARTREYGGSGIGLSIVKAIMQRLGESYGVINEKDGVTFYFDIKLSQNDE